MTTRYSISNLPDSSRQNGGRPPHRPRQIPQNNCSSETIFFVLIAFGVVAPT